MATYDGKKSYRVAVFPGPNKSLEIVERAFPEVGEHQVLLKVEAASICHRHVNRIHAQTKMFFAQFLTHVCVCVCVCVCVTVCVCTAICLRMYTYSRGLLDEKTGG